MFECPATLPKATPELLQGQELSSSPSLLRIIEEGILSYWSPEQIVNRYGLDISVPTIYRAVKCGLLAIKKISPYLRCRGNQYKRNIKETRGSYPDVHL